MKWLTSKPYIEKQFERELLNIILVVVLPQTPQ